jgi:hypothetical protein
VLARQWCRLEVELYIAGDEKIDVTVAIIVQKRTTCTPGLIGTSYTGLLGNVLKVPVAIVVKKRIESPIRDEKILLAIVVDIGGAHAIAPPGPPHTGSGSDIGELASPAILKQMIRWFLAFCHWLKTRAIHEKDVKQTIVVEVDERDACTVCFDDVLLPRRIPLNEPRREARRNSDINES